MPQEGNQNITSMKVTGAGPQQPLGTRVGSQLPWPASYAPVQPTHMATSPSVGHKWCKSSSAPGSPPGVSRPSSVTWPSVAWSKASCHVVMGNPVCLHMWPQRLHSA